MKKEKPYIINRHVDRYARKNWFTDYWIPGVTLKTTVEVGQLAANLKARGLSFNSVLIWSLAKALSEFPKLNYYTFWGKLVWAGDSTKISIVIEEHKNEMCGGDFISEAEKKSLQAIHQELLSSAEKIKNVPQDNSFVAKVMNAFPKIAYYVKRFSGQLMSEYANAFGPIIITNLNVEGVETMQLCGVYFSMIISPGKIHDNKLQLLLTFNHQLANARPVGMFLARVKEILEKAEFDFSKSA